VAAVFDDMVERSVPGYETIQLLVSDLALRLNPNGVIYDLGCSTGTTLNCIAKRAVTDGMQLIGFDQSEDMVDQCREKLRHLTERHVISIATKDIIREALFSQGEPGVVILCLVLQFVRPMQRAKLVQKIYDGLKPGGALLMVEKTICEDEATNRFFVDYYHSYKAEMGYSEMEIAAKREALENVLIPFTRIENIQLLKDAGFETVESFFQWMNFSGFLAIKK
jgi:tRNA (cmo5U34)-methyltransferase